jgi:hypothetical protein
MNKFTTKDFLTMMKTEIQMTDLIKASFTNISNDVSILVTLLLSKTYGKKPSPIPMEGFKDIIQDNLRTLNESQRLDCVFKNALSRIDYSSHVDFVIANKVGKQSIQQRKLRIFKYKLKMIKKSIEIPVDTKYEGRSEIAKNKVRLRGRFIKKRD